MKQHRVFVYGTIMSGHRNADIMRTARYVGQTKTLFPSYEMIQFPSSSCPGAFTPGVINYGNAHIEGEVYLLSDNELDILDRFESEGSEYTRNKILLADGSQAWTYILKQSKDQCPAGAPNYVAYNADEKTYCWKGDAPENMMRKAV